MTTKTGIIYLQREKFQIYSPYLANILEFRFVPELIQDFDFVNNDLFKNLLKVFLANNKVPPSGIVIIVADSASFIKDFILPPTVVTNPMQPVTSPLTLEDLHNQANKYLEHVPFENVASKVFPLATGVRAYATNQEIYEGLKAILEKQGFIIQTVLPGFIFGSNLSNLPTIDGPSVSAMLQRVGTLQAYNLLKEAIPVSEPAITGESTTDTEEKDTASVRENAPDKTENKKVLIAVVVSAVALIVVITGVVIYFQFQERPYVPPPTPVQTTNAPQVTPSASSSEIMPEAKELTAQIIAPSASASTAAVLRTTLTDFGFKSVVPQTQETVTQSLLVFSSLVGQQVKDVITSAVKRNVPNIVVQDDPNATVDVSITLGK